MQWLILGTFTAKKPAPSNRETIVGLKRGTPSRVRVDNAHQGRRAELDEVVDPISYRSVILKSKAVLR